MIFQAVFLVIHAPGGRARRCFPRLGAAESGPGACRPATNVRRSVYEGAKRKRATIVERPVELAARTAAPVPMLPGYMPAKKTGPCSRYRITFLARRLPGRCVAHYDRRLAKGWSVADIPTTAATSANPQKGIVLNHSLFYSPH